jgi:anti-anti-sigma factor
MNLTLLSVDDAVTRLACSGSITQISPLADNDPVAEALGPEVYCRRLLMDLERADFVDSSGIGWMILCHKRFMMSGGRLVFHSAPPLVRQMLDLLGLGRILHIAADENAARGLAQEVCS